MPLPAVPTLGDAYADLRQLTHVSLKHIEAAVRLASMAPQGVERFCTHIIGFLVEPTA